MNLWFELTVLLGLSLLNGVFSGAEIAILSVRKTRLQELADEGNGSAKAALRLRANPERFLATVQIGITVVGASAAAFGGSALEAPIAAWLLDLGAGSYARTIALASVVALVSYLSLVFGELVPKSLALRSSEAFIRLVARMILGLAWLGRPLVWFLTASSNLVLRPFRDQTTFTETKFSPDELQQLLEEAATVGSIDPSASEIASRAIDFGKLRVGAVMVPRLQIVGVHHDASDASLRALLDSSTHARFPVLGAAPDEIVGYVAARDLYRYLLDGGSGRNKIASICRKIPVFTEDRRASDVLAELQKKQISIGVVVDEENTLAGLITIEELIEELVGEIRGEHEVAVKRIHVRDDGTATVLGITAVHELNRELGTDLAEGEGWTTIAGLVMTIASHIPQTGERIDLGEGVVAEVLEATPRQLKLLRLHLPSEQPESAEAPT